MKKTAIMKTTIQTRMKRKSFACLLILLIIFACQLSENAFGQDEPAKLSKTKYIDPNEFFNIVPPSGWKVQNYPDDPRGKVAFFGPNDVELRILAKGLDHSSFDKMLEELKDIEKQISTNTNIKQIEFSGVKAIEREFIIKGIKVYFIDFMIGNISHNLMYSAQPSKFAEYKNIAYLSFLTYEPSLIEISPENVSIHRLSSVSLSRDEV